MSYEANKDNWMKLPFPDSKVLSERLHNAVRLYDISQSGEAGRGMLKVAAEEAASIEAVVAADAALISELRYTIGELGAALEATTRILSDLPAGRNYGDRIQANRKLIHGGKT